MVRKTADGKKRSYRPTSETRQLLCDKALELMKKNGYQGTTVRSICSALDLPTGTFYNCFKSKSEIFHGIYAMGDGFFETEIRNSVKGLPFPRQLEVFASGYAKVNEQTGMELMRVLFNTQNDWFSQTRPMQDVLMSVLEDGVEQGYIDPMWDKSELVAMIFDTLRGVCFDWCVSGGAFDMGERMRRHMSLLLPGLRETGDAI